MKKFLCIILALFIQLPVFAEFEKVKKFNNLPQGTFKKNRNGDIIQYDRNGKRVGVYKIQTERYRKIK